MIDFKAHRANHGMSQRALAEAIGVTEDVVRSLEEGRKPQPTNALLVARYVSKVTEAEVLVTDLWPIDTEAAA